jgi:hypothetical protein
MHFGLPPIDVTPRSFYCCCKHGLLECSYKPVPPYFIAAVNLSLPPACVQNSDMSQKKKNCLAKKI